MDERDIITVSIEQDENGWLTVESKELPDLLVFTKESLDDLLRSLPEKIKAIYQDDNLIADKQDHKRVSHPKIRAQVEYNHWH